MAKKRLRCHITNSLSCLIDHDMEKRAKTSDTQLLLPARLFRSLKGQNGRESEEISEPALQLLSFYRKIPVMSVSGGSGYFRCKLIPQTFSRAIINMESKKPFDSNNFRLAAIVNRNVAKIRRDLLKIRKNSTIRISARFTLKWPLLSLSCHGNKSVIFF